MCWWPSVDWVYKYTAHWVHILKSTQKNTAHFTLDSESPHRKLKLTEFREKFSPVYQVLTFSWKIKSRHMSWKFLSLPRSQNNQKHNAGLDPNKDPWIDYRHPVVRKQSPAENWSQNSNISSTFRCCDLQPALVGPITSASITIRCTMDIVLYKIQWILYCIINNGYCNV